MGLHQRIIEITEMEYSSLYKTAISLSPENEEAGKQIMRHWKKKHWIILIAVIIAAIILGAVCGKIILDNII